ncbi:MAG TPA: alpha/beta hydrolase [Patescibacteria group bacterium]|nr:alpha/beta hydrolase [Patescibacteria group bacterium]
MKNAIIFHGTGETPNHYWYPWLKKELEKRGFSVSIPQLPDTDHPDVKKWLPVALQEDYSEETIVIGHSAGSTLILALLETVKSPIKQAILTAAFYENLPEFSEPIIKPHYDWTTIKKNSNEIIVVNSDNDPWGCTPEVGLDLLGKIGGTLIVPHGEGHMGSDTFNQPMKEFPLLLKFIA